MNNTFYNTLALKTIRRSISMAFAGIYEELVSDLQIGVRLLGCYILGRNNSQSILKWPKYNVSFNDLKFGD